MERILIVEDEIAYLKLLEDQLKLKGFDVLTAKNGKIGLQTALKAHPDLILLDIRMPVMDGITMLDELRKDEFGATAKVIMLTNLEPDAEIISKSIKNKPAYYLIKSDNTVEDLFEMIDKLLKRNKIINLGAENNVAKAA